MKELKDYTREELIEIIKQASACSFSTIEQLRSDYVNEFSKEDPNNLPPEAHALLFTTNFLVFTSAPMFEIGLSLFPKSREFIEGLIDMHESISGILDKKDLSKWETQ